MSTKKILVPTDFSDCAHAAFLSGLNLAIKLEAELHLLHIINSPYDWVKVPKDLEKKHPDILKKTGEARANLTQLVTEAKRHGIKAIPFIAYNKSLIDVNQHVVDFSVDLIVMGTYGVKGIKRLIGSNVRHTLQNISVPLLAVKSNFDLAKLKHITFATDTKNPEKETIADIKKLVAVYNLAPDIVLINTPVNFEDSKRSMDKLKTFAKKHGFEKSSLHIYNSFSIGEGIVRFNNTSKNLILVEYHKKSLLEKIVNPSVTEYLLSQSASAIMAFPV